MRKISSLKFILDLFFPISCLGCGKEEVYLCQDCLSTLEIFRFHQTQSIGDLTDLYFALEYKNHLVKTLVQNFKYQPFIKELAKPLASLIITHFCLLDVKTNFSEFILIPIPLHKKRLKWRGFNQAEEIGKELSKFLNIPLVNDVLFKTKKTFPQTELSGKEREENVRGAFFCKNSEIIKGKKILLVDDIYTTGATIKECARVLKAAGAREIVGIVVAKD